MIRYVLALAASAIVFAQTGALSGRVVDSQGRAVADATVRLLRQSDSWRTASDAQGAFTFDRLSAGDFVLEVEKSQFRRESRLVHFTGSVTATETVKLDVDGVNQTVLVTATGGAQVEQENSKAVSVVSNEEIVNRNAISLGDIVRYSPGIQVRNGGGIGQLTTFRMRGLRADAAAVLIDGLRFRDSTTLQADASSFISSLNFVNADRVEVLRGSGSSLYGTNAVGGAINVVTPQGGGPTHGELQLEGGNLGLFRTRGSVSGGLLGDRLKYSGGLLHLNVMNGIDGDDAARSTGGQGFLRYDLTPRMSVSARLLGSDDFVKTNISPSTSGIPSANLPSTGFVNAAPLSPASVAVLNAGGKVDYGNATFVPGRDDPDARRASRFLSSAFVFRDAAANFNWQASYQRTHTNRVYDDGPAGTGFQPAADNHSQYLGNIDTADVHGTVQLTRHISVTGGYEFEREIYSDLQNNNLPGTRLVFEQSHVGQNSHTGYFASQFALFDRRLQISVSGRAQAFQLSKPEFQLTGTANNYNKVALQSPPAAFTGDVAASYLLARSSTKLRGHFGNAYRTPSLYERFGGGFSSNPATGVVGFTAYGDPRLASDRYNSVDGGIDQYLFGNRAKVSATYFYTRVIHLTAFDFSGIVNAATDPFGRSYGYINGSGGISRGAELSVETRPMRSLTINGSYTYVNENTDRDQSVPGFYKLFSLQPHTFTIVATKQWGRKFDTTVDMYHGSSYYLPLFAVSRTRVYSFPGFTKTGMTANYRVWQGEKHSVRAYARVDNLFNQTYYEAGWLASKATFAVGMGYAF